MRPIAFSERDFKESQIGWRRVGSACSYYRRKVIRIIDPINNEISSKNQYALTFNIEFSHSKDSVYIALSQPYSYTQLQLFLQSLQKDPYSKLHLRREELCRSLAANRVDLLIITENCDRLIPKLPAQHIETPRPTKVLSELDKMDLLMGLNVGADDAAQGTEYVPKFLKKMQDKLDEEARQRQRQRDLV